MAVAHKQGFESVDEIETCVLEPGGNFFIKGKMPQKDDRQRDEIIKLLHDIRERVTRLEKRVH
jgi:hypothetical protein